MAKYRFFAELIIQKRLELGFRTSRKFHSSLASPPIEYQSWLHMEAGRRLPRPKTAILVADCLKLPHEEAILAYTRDIFSEEYDEDGLRHLQDYARSFDLKRMCDRAEELKSYWYTLSKEQLAAFEQDIRLHEIMVLPFYRDRIHIRDLAEKMGLCVAKVLELVMVLVDIGLLKFHQEIVSKIYRGIHLPRTQDTFALRKKILVNRLATSMTPKSAYRNYTINLTAKDRDKVLKAFELIDAKCMVGHEESKRSEDAHTYQVVVFLSDGEKEADYLAGTVRMENSENAQL